MRLSKRCEYGLRAVIDIGIAHAQGRSWVPANELAAHERIPETFLEQILLDLAKGEFLRSRRGPQGGYALARPADEIRMSDVVRLLEGTLAPIPCVSRVAYEPCSCPDEDHCGLRLLMMDVRAAVAAALQRTTLAQLVDVTMREYRHGDCVPFAVREGTGR